MERSEKFRKFVAVVPSLAQVVRGPPAVRGAVHLDGEAAEDSETAEAGLLLLGTRH